MCAGRTQPERTISMRVQLLAVALLFFTGCGNQDAKPARGSEATTPPEPEAEATIAGRPASQFVLRKDMFEALTNPALVLAEKAGWLSAEDLVLGYVQGTDARAYPLRQLAYHHVVNDVVDEQPVLVTFCSLSGNALVFDREANGQIDEFGVAGYLQGTLLLYDKRTGSTWSQVTGRCLDGFRKGEVLRRLTRGRLLMWRTWRAAHPGTRVVPPRADSEARYPEQADWLPGAAYVPAGVQASLPALSLGTSSHRLVLGFEDGDAAYAVPVPEEGTGARILRIGSRVLLLWRVSGLLDVRLFVLPPSIGGADGGSVQVALREDGTLRVGEGDRGSVFRDTGAGVSGAAAGMQLASVTFALIEDYAWRVYHPDLRVVEH